MSNDVLRTLNDYLRTLAKKLIFNTTISYTVLYLTVCFLLLS